MACLLSSLGEFNLLIRLIHSGHIGPQSPISLNRLSHALSASGRPNSVGLRYIFVKNRRLHSNLQGMRKAFCVAVCNSIYGQGFCNLFIAGRDDPGALYTDEFQVMQF